jgi:hypothetical protein
MVGLVDRGLALNPSFAQGWYVSVRAGESVESHQSAGKLSLLRSCRSPSRAHDPQQTRIVSGLQYA